MTHVARLPHIVGGASFDPEEAFTHGAPIWVDPVVRVRLESALAQIALAAQHGRMNKANALAHDLLAAAAEVGQHDLVGLAARMLDHARRGLPVYEVIQRLPYQHPLHFA